jgi:Zn/Cd-binding protein ZinT
MSKKSEIKDAYPKKVCHMLRHVKKTLIRKEKERQFIQRSSYTIHQKKSTHLHI